MKNLLFPILLLCSASAFSQEAHNNDQIVIGYHGKPVIRIADGDTVILDQDAANRMLIEKVMAKVPKQDPKKPYISEEGKKLIYSKENNNRSWVLTAYRKGKEKRYKVNNSK